ncbi:alpha/beta fold hydrolase [Polaromonas sp. YR568]|uniref:alpha/beta hydrolase n=1 Tax=Polaromonas sp. YR568 TaxID=1855301 RepID=UPI0031382451
MTLTRTNNRWPSALAGLVGLVSVVAILVGVWQLEAAFDGVSIDRQRLGTTPVTVFRPAPAAGVASAISAPVVLIAHGFAGSQQLMQPFALTLARNGFTAITFDFPGHGRNPAPMPGGITDTDQSLQSLLAAMTQMGAFAAQLSQAKGGDGRYAVVGHSMASDIVVRHAQAHPDVVATVGVSLFAPSISASTPGNSPRNLLVVAGAMEPAMMADEALRVVARVAGADAKLDTTYGRFEDGTARKATLAPGVEHIAVLYSRATLKQTLDWLSAAWGRPPAAQAFTDSRGPWLGWLLAGVVGLAWPLSRLLPRVARSDSDAAPRARMRWWGPIRRSYLPLAVLPAVITPLVLWRMPGNLLPLLLGDYLVMHFALYGLLTLLGMALVRRTMPGAFAGVAVGSRRAAALAVAMATAYALFAVGLPVDSYVFNVQPEPARLPLILAMCLGTLPYFIADEWLTRDAGAARGAYLVTKVCFLLSLVLAIALNPAKLFFLAIIVPAILLLFVVYGLFSRWTFASTGHPAVAALANALTFACFVAVTFPIVA